MIDDEQLRLDCLRLAEAQFGGDPKTTVETARIYSDFVLGTKDAEVVRAAKQLAQKVAA